MLTSGDIVHVDLGVPIGHEAGFPRPVVVVTAQDVLDRVPSVVQIVPLTSTLRRYRSEVTITRGTVGLPRNSSAQCQHMRSVSTPRVSASMGNVGPVDLQRIREVIALLLDIGM